MTRASSILFWFTLIFVVSVGLYQTSYKVEQLDRQLRGLNAQIDMERRNLHILKAEWVYLSNPARIEAAARKHLNLQPTTTTQLAKLERLASLLPSQNEAMGTVTVAATPIAGLRTRTAAHAPRPSTDEVGRMNTHLVIGKPAQQTATARAALPLRLAGDDSYGLADVGYRQ